MARWFGCHPVAGEALPLSSSAKRNACFTNGLASLTKASHLSGSMSLKARCSTLIKPASDILASCTTLSCFLLPASCLLLTAYCLLLTASCGWHCSGSGWPPGQSAPSRHLGQPFVSDHSLRLASWFIRPDSRPSYQNRRFLLYSTACNITGLSRWKPRT